LLALSSLLLGLVFDLLFDFPILAIREDFLRVNPVELCLPMSVPSKPILTCIIATLPRFLSL
jgi:hypothetical protein